MTLRERLAQEMAILSGMTGVLVAERQAAMNDLDSGPTPEKLERFFATHYRMQEYLDRATWIGKVLDEDASN